VIPDAIEGPWRTAPPANTVSPGRLVFRFLVGAAKLGEERLLGALAPTPRIGADDGEDGTGIRYAAIGALVRLPEVVNRALTRTPAGAATPSRARRLVGGALSLVGRSPPARRTRKALSALRARVAAGVSDLAATGRIEENAGKALAEDALARMVHRGFSALAESDQIRGVIREQSTSLGETAITEVRTQTAEADDRVEGAFRRVFRRRREDTTHPGGRR
jgi:hypothetical protein